MTISIKEIIEVLDQIAEETPYDDGSNLFDKLFANTGIKPRTYREKLDAPKYNIHGRAIPRIIIVRRNIRLLKTDYRTWRGLNVKDRRQCDRRRK